MIPVSPDGIPLAICTPSARRGLNRGLHQELGLNRSVTLNNVQIPDASPSNHFSHAGIGEAGALLA
tara:strand:+ start:3329 stop:3526 length:198 start_codon:yes stop_codon:yes gene_type:complete